MSRRVDRGERFSDYVHPHYKPLYTLKPRVGVIDASRTTISTTVSPSRTSSATAGTNIMMSSTAMYTPRIKASNAYPFYAEASSEVIDLAPIEQTLFAINARINGGISNEFIMMFDGTFPIVIHEFITTSLSQIRTGIIGYNHWEKYFVIGGINLIDSSIKAFKLGESGISDISSGVPSGMFRDSFFSAYDGCIYFLHYLSGSTLSKYDGTSWTTIGAVSGTPVGLGGVNNALFDHMYIATTSSVYLYTEGSLTLDFTATSGYSVEEVTIFLDEIWLAERNSSGTANVWQKAGDDWTLITTFSNVGQISLGVLNQILRDVSELFAVITDTTNTNAGATIYRYNWSTVWELEGSIYSGRRWEDTTNLGSPPFYFTGNRRFAWKSFRSLQGNMMLFLPFTHSSGSSINAGVDLWCRKSDGEANNMTSAWYHEATFNSRYMEDDAEMILPSFTARYL